MSIENSDPISEAQDAVYDVYGRCVGGQLTDANDAMVAVSLLADQVRSLTDDDTIPANGIRLAGYETLVNQLYIESDPDTGELVGRVRLNVALQIELQYADGGFTLADYPTPVSWTARFCRDEDSNIPVLFMDVMGNVGYTHEGVFYTVQDAVEGAHLLAGNFREAFPADTTILRTY